MVQNTTSEPTEVLPQTPPPAKVPSLPQSTTLQILSGLPTVLEKASPQQRKTASRLQSFATTGEMASIRDVNREDIRSLADLLVAELGEEALAATVESHLGLPADRFLAHGRPADRLADVFDAIRTESGPTNSLPLVFSDQVEANGSVTGNVHVIPAGTRRIYAAFENAGGLQGLDQVLAVWRNPADDRMVFTEYEPVRTGSVYNYVWLELDEGWPAGFYQLDLFDPVRNSQRLASRGFNVR